MAGAEASLSRSSLSGGLRSFTPARAALALLLLAASMAAMWIVVDGSLLRLGFEQLWGRSELIALILLGYGSAFLLRAFAWRALLPAEEQGAGRPDVDRLFSILHASLFANHLLPFKAGEALRPVLAMRAGVPLSAATVSTITARLLDLVALLAITATLLPLTVGIEDARAIVLPAVLIGAALGVLLWARGAAPRATQIALIDQLWAEAYDALRALTRRRLLVAFAFTVPSWVLESVVVYSAAQALGVELSWPAAAAVTAFTILFQVVHLTPGGIGIYEASMIAALQVQGVPVSEAVTLAVLTHAIKFVYAFGIGGPLALLGGVRIPTLAGLRGSRDDAKRANRFEIVAARLWNVLNEGKSFTPVFALGVLVLLGMPHLSDGGYWLRLVGALVALVPLMVVLVRFDFPLRLRAVLWVALGAMLALFRLVDPTAIVLVLALYLGFAVTRSAGVYHRQRIGMSPTNFIRFWKLVATTSGPTSGNLLEQVPKLLILVLSARFLADGLTAPAVVAVEAYTLCFALVAVLVHQWWFTWVPGDSLTATRLVAEPGARISRRVILIVIDGCRADRFAEAHTPFIDSLAADGVRCADMHTVYPARTLTAVSTMLTGAAPRTHGIRSNLSRGLKCESIFDALDAHGMRGRLVGSARLGDAFGEESVERVPATKRNEAIDEALVARAREILKQDDPDLLVLQTRSVDQTGQVQGSDYPEYLAQIEETDRLLERFIGWCRDEGYLEETTVLVTSDHGQANNGGHGHLTEPERRVPFLAWGRGVPSGVELEGTRTLHDVAPTVAYYLGAPSPAQSVGQVLVIPEGQPPREDGPLAVIVPAYNEAETLPQVLARMPRETVSDLEVIVVDDGSSDGTAEIARAHGVEHVVVHQQNRGLGAALRTGLETARALDARAAVYLDADLEYDPREIPALLAPIESREADYVLGSRFAGTREGHPLARSIGNRLFTALLNVVAGHRISDGQTGFRAFSPRALAVAEVIHDYNYAQVLTLNLLRKGMRLRQVPITYRHRTTGNSFINLQYLWRVPLGMAREVVRE